MRQIIYLLIFLITLNTISATTIYGTIYDSELNKQNNVRLEINTVPKQYYVSKNGSYAFDVPVGNYVVKANYYADNILESSAEENITIKDEGLYVLDLILFPSFEEEDIILNETEMFVIKNFEEEEKNYKPVIAVILTLLFIFILFIANYKKYKKFDKKKEETDLTQIIKIIKEEGGRTTQKDIRKKIPLSEAKISLMLAELEHKGVIKKIKKGRGNIIVLK